MRHAQVAAMRHVFLPGCQTPRITEPTSRTGRARGVATSRTTPISSTTPALAWQALLLSAALSFSAIADDALEKPAPSPEEAASKTMPLVDRPVDRDAIQKLIVGLNADSFAERDQATRELIAWGKAAIPQLVQAATDSSAEVRERSLVLLAKHEPFSDVAPHLLDVAGPPHEEVIWGLLAGRCVQQIDASLDVPGAEKLFQFWGTNPEVFRFVTIQSLSNAKTKSEMRRLVDPLVGLPDKARRFGDLVNRLSKLSVANDHRFAAGYVIAETMAKGLHDNRREYVEFATAYVASLETLAQDLLAANHSQHATRNEIATRAAWCQGATSYLVKLLDRDSPQRRVVMEQFAIAPGFLEKEFLRGLGSTDSVLYARGVGRIHIIDLLSESLVKWPSPPTENVAAELVQSVIRCAHDGDKAKALVYLEALDACRDLTTWSFDLREGLGRKLGERYFELARTAPDHRSYYSARNVHSKIRTLAECGVSPQHPLFPHETCERFTAASSDAVADAQRLAIDRYTSFVDRLSGLGVALDRPGAVQFARSVRKRLQTNSFEPRILDERLSRLARLYGGGQSPDAVRIDELLSEWAAEIESRSVSP